VVSNDRAFAMIAHGRAVTMIANVAAGTPATLDPHVAAAAALPPALHPVVIGALALPPAIEPDVTTAAVSPTPFDPHEARTGLDHDGPGRRRCFLHLNKRDRDADVRPTVNHTADGRGRDDRGESEASE